MAETNVRDSEVRSEEFEKETLKKNEAQAEKKQESEQEQKELKERKLSEKLKSEKDERPSRTTLITEEFKDKHPSQQVVDSNHAPREAKESKTDRLVKIVSEGQNEKGEHVVTYINENGVDMVQTKSASGVVKAYPVDLSAEEFRKYAESISEEDTKISQVNVDGTLYDHIEFPNGSYIERVAIAEKPAIDTSSSLTAEETSPIPAEENLNAAEVVKEIYEEEDKGAKRESDLISIPINPSSELEPVENAAELSEEGNKVPQDKERRIYGASKILSTETNDRGQIITKYIDEDGKEMVRTELADPNNSRGKNPVVKGRPVDMSEEELREYIKTVTEDQVKEISLINNGIKDGVRYEYPNGAYQEIPRIAGGTFDDAVVMEPPKTHHPEGDRAAAVRALRDLGLFPPIDPGLIGGESGGSRSESEIPSRDFSHSADKKSLVLPESDEFGKISPEEAARYAREVVETGREGQYINYFQFPIKIEDGKEKFFDIYGHEAIDMELVNMDTRLYGYTGVLVPAAPREKWKYINRYLMMLEETSVEGGGSAVKAAQEKTHELLGILESPKYQLEQHEEEKDPNHEVGKKLTAIMNAAETFHNIDLKLLYGTKDEAEGDNTVTQIYADQFNTIIHDQEGIHEDQEVERMVKYYMFNIRDFISSRMGGEKTMEKFREKAKIQVQSEVRKARSARGLKITAYDEDPKYFAWVQTRAERFLRAQQVFAQYDDGTVSAKDEAEIQGVLKEVSEGKYDNAEEGMLDLQKRMNSLKEKGSFKGGFDGAEYFWRRIFWLDKWMTTNAYLFNFQLDILFPEKNPKGWVDFDQGFPFVKKYLSQLMDSYELDVDKGGIVDPKGEIIAPEKPNYQQLKAEYAAGEVAKVIPSLKGKGAWDSKAGGWDPKLNGGKGGYKGKYIWYIQDEKGRDDFRAVDLTQIDWQKWDYTRIQGQPMLNHILYHTGPQEKIRSLLLASDSIVRKPSVDGLLKPELGAQLNQLTGKTAEVKKRLSINTLDFLEHKNLSVFGEKNYSFGASYYAIDKLIHGGFINLKIGNEIKDKILGPLWQRAPRLAFHSMNFGKGILELLKEFFKQIIH